MQSVRCSVASRLRMLRGCLHGADDLVVAGAAAQVAGQLEADLVLAGIGVAYRAGPWPRHDEAGRADAALQGGAFQKALLQRVQMRLRRRCPSIVVISAPSASTPSTRQLFDRHAVEQHGAGAAVAVVAAFLAPVRLQRVAQHFQQALPRLAEELDRLAVDRGRDVEFFGHGCFFCSDCDVSRRVGMQSGRVG